MIAVEKLSNFDHSQFYTVKYGENMNVRLGEIRAEMSSLLAQQQTILNDPKIWTMSAEELDAFAVRSQRLRDLCKELLA
jgi:hypothetical protein